MIKYLSFSMAVLINVLAIQEVMGQCVSGNYSNACVSKVSEDFNFLKSYKIDAAGMDKVEFSYVFTKGTQYMIYICTAGVSADGIAVSLFDSDRNKVATSEIDGSYVSAVLYHCTATGIYYMQYTFEANSTKCGASVLAFKH